MATPAAAVDPPELEKAYTEHLGQLVTAPGKGGVNELNNRANGTVGMRGTDLGVSFESRGRLYFLFGDSFAMGGGPHLDDSIAVTDARSVDRFRMPSLSWAAGADGSFAPLRLPQASHGGMEVPVEGIDVAGRTYVFLVSGWHRDTRSYDRLVVGHLDAETMQTGRLVFDQVVETSRFLNVSAVEYGRYVYLFGAGNPYRESPVWLARFRPRAVDRYKQWRFLGQPLPGGRVRWEQREERCQPARHRQPAVCGRTLSASRRDERLFPDGVQLRRRRRRPPSRVLPADGAPALGAVERPDRAVRRHGGRRRLRRHPAFLDGRPAEPRRRPCRARPPLRPRCVRR